MGCTCCLRWDSVVGYSTVSESVSSLTNGTAALTSVSSGLISGRLKTAFILTSAGTLGLTRSFSLSLAIVASPNLAIVRTVSTLYPFGGG